jgi:hypothetical protein
MIANARRIFLLFFWLFYFQVSAQVVGLIQTSGSVQPGFTLFHPDFSRTTYLIDNAGNIVNSWDGQYTPGRTVYLLENGLLLRAGNYPQTPFGAGGKGGYLELLDWDGNIVWSYLLSNDSAVQHHDMKMLPNGNILAVVWDKRSVTEAIQKGKNPDKLGNSLWSEKIIEFKPLGNNSIEVVWEWFVWDHLIQEFDASKENYGVVADHPEKVNINYMSSSLPIENWLHINAIDYNTELDQIMLSVHRFNEIWIIDHSTTREEARGSSGGSSGMGGDLLYRWGNNASFNRGTGNDQKLFGQHNCQWIPSNFIDGGKIIYFNNGAGRSEDYSSVEIIDPGFDKNTARYNRNEENLHLPLTPAWVYTASTKTDFFSRIISGAQRLANGNTLITEGLSGNFFEINQSKEVVWQYINPINNTGRVCDTVSTIANNGSFRANRYSPDFGAFINKELTPKGKVELTDCLVTTLGPDYPQQIYSVYPNPARDSFTVEAPEDSQMIIYNNKGTILYHQWSQNKKARFENLAPGFYLLIVKSKQQESKSIKIVIN